MKLVVVGLGQCGGRIADEFSRLNSRAKSRRGMNIITGCFAGNIINVYPEARGIFYE